MNTTFKSMARALEVVDPGVGQVSYNTTATEESLIETAASIYYILYYHCIGWKRTRSVLKIFFKLLLTPDQKPDTI